MLGIISRIGLRVQLIGALLVLFSGIEKVHIFACSSSTSSCKRFEDVMIFFFAYNLAICLPGKKKALEEFCT